MDSSKTIICRCEEITLDQLVETATAFQCTSRELKLRTRAGMGFCGGRTCRFLIDTIVEQVTNQTCEDAPLKYQPPIRPVTFGQLGGE